jgi:Ni/Co efflux regulator RcnB
MRKLNTLLVISLLASSAASADSPSRWSRDQPSSMARHGGEGPGRNREPREENRPARTENTQRQNEPRHTETPAPRNTDREGRSSRPNDYRRDPGYVRDARPENHNDQPRHDDQQSHDEAMNNHSRWTSGNRDQRGYTRDPRPGNRPAQEPSDDSRHDWNRERHWDGGRHDDHDNRGSRDDNNWTRDRDHWRDHDGHEWHHDYGWYNEFRGNHFFFNNGRYFARQRYFNGHYNAPWGYSSRLWVRGDILPFSYFESRYCVDDYDRFNLYEPPFGTRWVRVGYDALLVDTESGEVLDVLHDLFW